MPNVKRIRQDQEAAQKRYATYADQIAAYNANVDQVNAANQSANDLYNSQAAEYNAWQEQVKAGAASGYYKLDNGKYMALTGRDGALVPVDYHRRSQTAEMGAMFNSLEEAKASNYEGNFLVRNPDGTATPYNGTTKFVQAGPDYYQEVSIPWQATSMASQWNPVTRVAEFNTPAPTPQEVTTPTPEQPKAWNPSRRDLAELQAPTVDAAGAQMATARGEAANAGLVNEAVGRGSAFADPEDPNNLADKGILARVLGGQL